MRNMVLLASAIVLASGLAQQSLFAEEKADSGARHFLKVSTYTKDGAFPLVGPSNTDPAVVCMNGGDVALVTTSFNIALPAASFKEGMAWGPKITGDGKSFATLQRNHMPSAAKWVALSTTELFEVADDAKADNYLFSAGFTPPKTKLTTPFSVSNVSVVVTRYGLTRDCEPAHRE